MYLLVQVQNETKQSKTRQKKTPKNKKKKPQTKFAQTSSSLYLFTGNTEERETN